MQNLHITAQQIRIFEAVARLGSFTRAAEELNLSQPAVSIQVKRLEENNDVKLIEVVGKKLYLTPPGKQMFQSCQKILEELQELNVSIKSAQNNVEGELRMAVVTPAKYFMPYILKAFLNRFPDVRPSITVINRRRIIDELKNNQYDLSIMGRVPEELKMDAFPFFESELVVVAHPSHRLSKQKNIAIEDIANERFLMREVGSGIRSSVVEKFAEHDLHIEPYMELGSTESMKQAVMADLGISVLPKQAIRIEVKYGHLVILDVQEFPLIRNWYVARMKDKSLMPPSQAFLDFLQTVDIKKLLAMSDTR
ncbi:MULTISPECIES: LysR family transcriptional regulator [Thiomicrorhabdus]|uniref:LysR family transcriptional regulator n=1 Tax=Thiomicrorhabdus heinhorstiae TaxID=2748010 RepID=A0ABS0BYJ7_9GAMM|nr:MULTISPECIES: LysR family transcriptional regulator [Thiomicrorhabdus]MBF6058163.1 LysR family transcriptional regulator [Thiomicrorhabdus heinhorstiae]